MTTTRLIAVGVVLGTAAPGFAHKLGAEAKLVGNRIEVEAYFDDNTPAAGARVIALDAAERTVADGRTDERGRWQFPKPDSGLYRLVVDAGAGHRAEVPLTIPALPAPAPL